MVKIFLLTYSIHPISTQEAGRPLRSVEPEVSVNIEKPPYNEGYWVLLNESALASPLTQRYITQYTTRSGLIAFRTMLERGQIYLPFIKEEVMKRGLPMDLAYLPIIESSFTITTKSRSGAAGLWQFMMNSIAPYGMKVFETVDERYDFIKSTKGALQKLENEYKRLGNWELTLAAYNMGLGAVTRVIQKTEIRDYWELSSQNELKQETTHYVPKLTAVIYILSQPRKFGIESWNDPFEWTAITLPRQVSIDLLADETGISRALLRRMNAELLFGITPLGSDYKLKIPASHAGQVQAALDRKDLRLIRYHYHVVNHGDTLWSISTRYSTTVAMIEQHNPGLHGRYLKIGETIIIPAFGDAPPPPAPRSVTVQNYPGTHIVQKGETFWSLGRLYGIDPQELAESNGMKMDQILHEGRTIKVPIIE